MVSSCLGVNFGLFNLLKVFEILQSGILLVKTWNFELLFWTIVLKWTYEMFLVVDFVLLVPLQNHFIFWTSSLIGRLRFLRQIDIVDFFEDSFLLWFLLDWAYGALILITLTSKFDLTLVLPFDVSQVVISYVFHQSRSIRLAHETLKLLAEKRLNLILVIFGNLLLFLGCELFIDLFFYVGFNGCRRSCLLVFLLGR